MSCSPLLPVRRESGGEEEIDRWKEESI